MRQIRLTRVLCSTPEQPTETCSFSESSNFPQDNPPSRHVLLGRYATRAVCEMAWTAAGLHRLACRRSVPFDFGNSTPVNGTQDNILRKNIIFIRSCFKEIHTVQAS